MAFCQNCGQQFPDGTPQCPSCGMPMMQQPAYQQNPYPNQQQFAPNMNMQQPKKKGKGCLIAVLVVVGLSIISALSGNRNKSNGDSSSIAETAKTTKAITTATTEATTTTTEAIVLETPVTEQTSSESKESIIIIADEENEYSEEYTLNEGTEMPDTNIVYFVPAGKYEVTNTGENRNQFNVYSRETHIVDGWEEPLYTPVVLLIEAGETEIVEIPDDYYIEIHGGSFKLTPIDQGGKNELSKMQLPQCQYKHSFRDKRKEEARLIILAFDRFLAGTNDLAIFWYLETII